MSFLAPWAMVLGVIGALGAVLLHLVARQRPAAYLLPTARFIPERQSLVSRVASRPRDLLLLALRVLLLLAAGAAFARPVFSATHATRARIVLLDRSAAVADPADAWRRARALATATSPSLLIAFDSVATIVTQPELLDSVMRAPAVAPSPNGSLTAALVAARRAAGFLAAGADSVELVLVSPVTTSAFDAASWPVRARWPGAIHIERVAARADSAVPVSLERALPLTDVLGPALAAVPARASPQGVRVLRAPQADANDSAFARAGGTVVVWDSASASVIAAAGLALGDDVIVAPLGRRVIGDGGTVMARWADGVPAAAQWTLGAGCLREVGILMPTAGDLALRPGFQRVVRGLTAPCGAGAGVALADSAVVMRLAGPRALAPAAAFVDGAQTPSRIVPWLLGLALLCGALELVVRGRPARDEAAA